jgi:predicted alpha/beta-hydrolase family hydrolase
MSEAKLAIEWRVRVDEGETGAVYEPAPSPIAKSVFVCAHGAGGHMDDASIRKVSDVFRARGIGTVRFNFLYRERRSGRPDPMPRLQECVSAVAEHVRAELGPGLLLLGGRSMGGRAASMLAADGFACSGLILLAYPLHPAGRPEKLRDAHLPRIRVPVLCFNGTRDNLCRRDLMERTVGALPDWTMHWLEGADHGFHVLKSSGRTDAGVLNEVGDASLAWLAGVAMNRGGGSLNRGK